MPFPPPRPLPHQYQLPRNRFLARPHPAEIDARGRRAARIVPAVPGRPVRARLEGHRIRENANEPSLHVVNGERGLRLFADRESKLRDGAEGIRAVRMQCRRGRRCHILRGLEEDAGISARWAIYYAITIRAPGHAAKVEIHEVELSRARFDLPDLPECPPGSRGSLDGKDGSFFVRRERPFDPDRSFLAKNAICVACGRGGNSGHVRLVFERTLVQPDRAAPGQKHTASKPVSTAGNRRMGHLLP